MYFYNRELDLLQPFRLLMVLLLFKSQYDILGYICGSLSGMPHHSPKDCHIYSVWQRHMMYMANLNNTIAA